MDESSSFMLNESALLELERQEREILEKDLIDKKAMVENSPKRKRHEEENSNRLSSRIKLASQRQCEKRKQLKSRNENTFTTPAKPNINSLSRLLLTSNANMDLSAWERSIQHKLSPAPPQPAEKLVSREESSESMPNSNPHEEALASQRYLQDSVSFMVAQDDDEENHRKAELFIATRLASDKSIVAGTYHNESILGQSRSEPDNERNMSLVVDLNKDLHFLKNWNLPPSVVNEYKRKGVEEMFQWQCECLQNRRVLFDGANLVYSAPTSAGKTFVSEILMIKSIAERKKKALFILPFVSVVREKIYTLQSLLESSGIRVDGYYGGYQAPGSFESIDLVICTIEKANSIVNRLLAQNTLSDLGMIVIDEIHLISDPSRGYILELLLTKMLFMCRKYEHQIQLVGMSATLPNVNLLCKWLNAELYITDYRPVELREMIKIDKMIYTSDMKLIRVLDSKWSSYFPSDADDICELGMETVMEGYQLIIFCPSKDWCEQLCTNFARGVYRLFKENPKSIERVMDRSRIDALHTQSKSLATGIDHMLETCVRHGTAFHHAGLTADERDLVEMGFKEGTIKVLVATSTLSAGVNLPARRVIIRTPMFGQKIMSNLTYRQMIGRAGRKGQDTLGESILVCNAANSRMGKELVSMPLKPISSCLDVDNYAHLKRALLEIIAANISNTKAELELFINQTLYCQEHEIDFSYFKSTTDEEFKRLITQKSQKNVNDLNSEKSNGGENDPMKSSMSFLLEYEFIRLHTDDETNEMKFVPTKLGVACLSSAMPPKDGFMLLAELQKARQNFVLECDLHAIYLVTPFSVAYQLQQIDWTYFIEIYDKLPEMMKRVGKMVGVSDTFLIKAITGRQNTDWHSQQIHKRFYTALALQELVNEEPIMAVSQKYKIPRGLLQSLQQSASTFAAILTTFCQSLQWDLLVLILKQFRERLYFGIHPDLIDLMKISSVSSTRIARALYSNGIHNLTMLANSKKLQIEDILLSCAENPSGGFFISGKTLSMSAQEMAKLLITDAQVFVQNELGLKDVNWNQEESREKKEKKIYKKQWKRKAQPPQPAAAAVRVADIAKSAPKRKRESENNIQQLKNDSPKPSPVHKKVNLDTSIEYRKKLRSSIDLKSQFPSTPAEERSHNNSSLFKNSNISLSLEAEKSVADFLTIVAVLNDGKTYAKFARESLNQSNISISIGLSKIEVKAQTIGGNLLTNDDSLIRNEKKFNFMLDERRYVSCLCVTFGSLNDQVYHLDFQNCEKKDLIVTAKNLLKKIFSKTEVTISFYESRPNLKVLKSAFDIEPHQIGAKIYDVRMGSWILDPDKILDWQEMVDKFAPQQSKIFDFVSQLKSAGSLGLNHRHFVEPKIRAAIECLLIREISKGQLMAMESTSKLQKVLANLEIPTLKLLASMELYGFPVDSAKLHAAIERSTSLLKKLESYIFKLNGNVKFDLTSSKEVAKVVGIHRSQKKKISTAKNVLAKIDLPIAECIMKYRTLAKTISNLQPITRIVRDERVYSSSFSLTQTGRISMHEPNLQNVTKDFTVDFLDERGSSQSELVSFRSVFECKHGNVLLSADFCQLEMRILTHLCKDPKLMEIMRSGNEDIFKKIAARWNHIDERHVTEMQRSQTKQLCYGIIYGMGNKALAESMRVDEDVSTQVSEEFHKAYSFIRRYTETIVQKTKEKGYIETVTCRRRYLPAINSDNSFERGKAERQALNFAIQGSASDLVKNAMLRMEKNIKSCSLDGQCHLVLHLHDELFYEVAEAHWREAAAILRNSMEKCVNLHVPLLLKIKMGRNWGNLTEIQ